MLKKFLKWTLRVGIALVAFQILVNLSYWAIILNDIAPEKVNDPIVAHDLGEKYQFDQLSFVNNKDKATHYFNRAIELGNYKAYVNLGQMILYSQLGTLDYYKVNEYAQKALDAVYVAHANYLFGMVRLKEDSPFYDADQAEHYLTLSGDNGNQFAVAELMFLYFIKNNGRSLEGNYWQDIYL